MARVQLESEVVGPFGAQSWDAQLKIHEATSGRVIWSQKLVVRDCAVLLTPGLGLVRVDSLICLVLLCFFQGQFGV